MTSDYNKSMQMSKPYYIEITVLITMSSQKYYYSPSYMYMYYNNFLVLN